ncbi:MAG: IS1595 family transposase [Bdellovibrionota bacterium]
MDYPKNLREFDRLFAHKDACLHFLEQVRWGNSFRCQNCAGKDYWTLSTGLRRCQVCRFKNSVKTGTIFESSRLPLKMWFYSIWWITAQKAGVSALDLQKDVGLGSYRSAWLLLHKIRNAMTHADQTLLQGDIEVDEATIGTARGELLTVAAEFSGLKRIGRIRIERLSSTAAGSLNSFLTANIAKGSIIHTNDGKVYEGISSLGYKHLTKTPLRAKSGQSLPRIHIVSLQLQRWLKSTLRGRFESKHLDSYLEEFVFRFNRRTSKARGLLFQRVMENAVRVEPAPYSKIVGRKV